MGSVIGLSYSALEFVMKLNKVKNKLDCFQRIRIMEHRAIELINSEVKDEPRT